MAKRRSDKGSKGERDNFQDRAETREYKKGFRAGEGYRKRRGRRDSGSSTASNDNKYAIVAGEINDPNWNAPTAQILKDTFSISFPNVIGQPMEFSTAFTNTPRFSDLNRMKPVINVPSIMTIEFLPTYGDNQTPNDAINIGANSFYAFVVHMNSRNKTYDAPDLMQLGLALDSAYMWYSELVRVYGYINYYQWYNRDVPRNLVRMMGFDYDDLISKLADFRVFVNATCYKLSQIFFPTGFDYMTRHMWIVRDVYADSEDLKAQLYLFKPHGYYLWQEGPNATKHAGGYNEFYSIKELRNLIGGSTKAFTTTGMPICDFDDIIKITNAMINRIIESQDFNLMSGDIMKAFGTGKHIQLRGISETFALKPIYNKEILMEIENAEIIGAGDYTFMSEIWQPEEIGAAYLKTPMNVRYTPHGPRWVIKTSGTDQACVHYKPTTEAMVQNFMLLDGLYQYSTLPNSILNGNHTHIINMHMPNPTDKDVAVAINLKIPLFVRNTTNVSQNLGWFRNFGTEILTTAWILDPGSSVPMDFSTYNAYIEEDVGTGGQMFNSAMWLQKRAALATAFDWFPFFQTAMAVGVRDDYDKFRIEQSGVYGDWDNFTTIGADLLGTMHKMANLNKFTCKGMGEFSQNN